MPNAAVKGESKWLDAAREGLGSDPASESVGNFARFNLVRAAKKLPTPLVSLKKRRPVTPALQPKVPVESSICRLRSPF